MSTKAVSRMVMIFAFVLMIPSVVLPALMWLAPVLHIPGLSDLIVPTSITIKPGEDPIIGPASLGDKIDTTIFGVLHLLILISIARLASCYQHGDFFGPRAIKSLRTTLLFALIALLYGNIWPNILMSRIEDVALSLAVNPVGLMMLPVVGFLFILTSVLPSAGAAIEENQNFL